MAHHSTSLKDSEGGGANCKHAEATDDEKLVLGGQAALILARWQRREK